VPLLKPKVRPADVVLDHYYDDPEPAIT